MWANLPFYDTDGGADVDFEYLLINIHIVGISCTEVVYHCCVCTERYQDGWFTTFKNGMAPIVDGP